MPHVTPEELESYLTQYGWSYSKDDTNVWKSGWQGDERLFGLIVRLSGTCVSFEVTPLIDWRLDWRQWPHMLRDLMALNNRLQLVKLAVDDAGEVSLSCQVLAAGFSYEILCRILGIIGYYADVLVAEICQKLTDYNQQSPNSLPV